MYETTDGTNTECENRARFLLEVVRAVRRAVGRDFPVALKLNSDDFRKGGFNHAECLQVVQWLNGESLDLLELSGGTYEQPRLLGAEGRADSVGPVRPSTRARGAYFLDYAAAVRKVARMPLMVTGGFRSRGAMEAALESSCDVIGLGRPLCWQPDLPRRLLSREVDHVARLEDRLRFAERGWRSPSSPLTAVKMLNAFGAQSWYYCQLFRLAEGRPADLGRYVRRKTILPVCGAGYNTLAKISSADLVQMESDLDAYFQRTQGKPWKNYKAVIVLKGLVTGAQALPVIMDE